MTKWPHSFARQPKQSARDTSACAGSASLDDVRAYARPEVKYAYFRVGASLSKEERAKYKHDPLHREVVVELYDESGERPVGRARGYHGSTHVSIASDAWDVFPAAAVVKVFYLDEQVGAPQKIDGLYPGGLWRISMAQ